MCLASILKCCFCVNSESSEKFERPIKRKNNMPEIDIVDEKIKDLKTGMQIGLTKHMSFGD